MSLFPSVGHTTYDVVSLTIEHKKEGILEDAIKFFHSPEELKLRTYPEREEGSPRVRSVTIDHFDRSLTESAAQLIC